MINYVNGFYGKHHIEIVLKSDKKMAIHLSPYSSDNDISELKIQCIFISDHTALKIKQVTSLKSTAHNACYVKLSLI